ncbi:MULTISPECIES: single-stranded DNA-binding protein [unclassified Agrococcus]|uniref:single-stranded DNA-binding protein n=1 Tax=unclassified Agrococcus TaxID=2615065 RepID=UPI003611308C
MTDRITIEGTAGTSPQLRTIASGRQVANLRVASNLRRQDPASGQWVDAGTNWYTVSAWGDLASHVVESIRQGDPVLVTGRLRIAIWGEGERQGTSVEIDAEAIGHSLRWGTATFQRRSRAASESAQPIAAPPQEPHGTETSGTHPPGIDERGWASPGAAAAGVTPVEPRAPALVGAVDEPPF